MSLILSAFKAKGNEGGQLRDEMPGAPWINTLKQKDRKL